METTKTSNFTCQSKSYLSVFFTCQVSACELQPFSCHDLANDIYSQTAKTVFMQPPSIVTVRSCNMPLQSDVVQVFTILTRIHWSQNRGHNSILTALGLEVEKQEKGQEIMS